MLPKLFIFLLVVCFIQIPIFSQVRKKPVSTKNIDKVPVFPGCEQLLTQNLELRELNKHLVQCFNQKLLEKLNNQLNTDTLSLLAEKNQEYEMKAKIDFLVNEQGKIT